VEITHYGDLGGRRARSHVANQFLRGVLGNSGVRLANAYRTKKAKRVLGMHADGLSYRLIARNVGLSKNTVMDIVGRNNGEQ